MLRPHDLSRANVEPSRTLTCAIRAASGRGKGGLFLLFLILAGYGRAR